MNLSFLHLTTSKEIYDNYLLDEKYTEDTTYYLQNIQPKRQNWEGNLATLKTKIVAKLWQFEIADPTFKSNWSSLSARVFLFFLWPFRTYRVHKAANLVLAHLQENYAPKNQFWLDS